MAVYKVYIRKDGTTVRDERAPEEIKFGLKDIFMLIGAIVTLVTAFTFTQAKVSAQDEKNRVLFEKAGEASELAKKHETMFPFIQAQLTELGANQKKMDDKFDKLMDSNNQILRAVKQ